MKNYELVIVGLVLVGCGAFLYWALRDMFMQLKAYDERCESLDEDDEE